MGTGCWIQADCHEGIGGLGNGADNDTGTEPEDVATQAGELDVIFGVGGAKAACCLGTVGAGNCGGWPNVGAETIAGDAEAMDGALLVAPALSGPISRDTAILSLRYPISRDTF